MWADRLAAWGMLLRSLKSRTGLLVDGYRIPSADSCADGPVVDFFPYEAWQAWYLKHQELVESNEDLIAVHRRTKSASGDYEVVQAIFNKSSNELVFAIRTIAKKVDGKIEEVGGLDELVVLQ